MPAPAPNPGLPSCRETVTVAPAAAAAGAVKLVTSRSGPIEMAAARWLFVSLTSTSSPSASAFAKMKYVPVATASGRVSDTVAVEAPPIASASTGRPPSSASAPSRNTSRER